MGKVFSPCDHEDREGGIEASSDGPRLAPSEDAPHLPPLTIVQRQVEAICKACSMARCLLLSSLHMTLSGRSWRRGGGVLANAFKP